VRQDIASTAVMFVRATDTRLVFRTDTRWSRLAGGYGSALGFGAGIAATIVAAMLEGGLIAPILVVAAVSAVTTIAGAAATGGQCWLLYASFVLGRAGDLNLDRASIQAAVILGCTAVLATAIGAIIRRLQTWHPALIPSPRRLLDQSGMAQISR
jgi:hypothetical protein